MSEELVWNFEDIEDQIPDLKAMDVKNTRYKALAEKLAGTVHSFGRQLKKEIKIVTSNRSHLLNMDLAELAKVEPLVLIEAISVVFQSLVEEIKSHRPSYQKMLQLTTEKEVASNKYLDIQARLDTRTVEFGVRVQELETKVELQNREIKERDSKIRALESELEALKIKQIKLEREVSKAEGTAQSMTLENKQIGMKDLYDLKKALDDDVGGLKGLGSKNKQISSLKILNKKKDQQLIKGALLVTLDDLQLNLFKIRVSQKGKEVTQLHRKNAVLENELLELKQMERQRERLEQMKEVKPVDLVHIR